MKETLKLLYEFWSSFGLPAYVENVVPDNAVLPYITYFAGKPDWMNQASVYARVWYRDESFISISEKVDEISERIGEGISLPAEDGGSVVIYKDSNFVQFLEDSTEEGLSIKIAYLSLIQSVYM